MKRQQQKMTYGLFIAALARLAAARVPKYSGKRKMPKYGTSVLRLGVILKKRRTKVEAFRYEQMGNGQIVKVAA